MSTRGMFRMTEVQQFDPGLLGIQAIRVNGCNSRPGNRGPSVTFGAARVEPSQWDEEKISLLGDRPRREGMSSASALTLCAAVSLWFLIIAVIFIVSPQCIEQARPPR